MKRTVFFLFLIFLSNGIFAQNPVQKYVEQLKTTDELKEAVWGVRAVKVSGEVIADWNSSRRMIPASNLKLLTTGIALNELGSSHRFKTRLAYSGTIEGGTLKGDLYIVGGGDPTIGGRDGISTPLQTTFSQWAKLLRSAGITSIEGRVIGDGRWLDCEMQNPSWQMEDAATGDGTVMTGLSFAEGLQYFTLTPGAVAGAPVKVEVSYPETPWMTWSHSCTTGAAGSKENLLYTSTPLAPLAGLSGSMPAGSRSKRQSFANNFGAMTCAFYFYRYLESSGFNVSEGPADIDPFGNVRDFSDESGAAAVAQTKLRFIGETLSPTVSDIVRMANVHSDNYYAEALLRVLAKERTGSACKDSCTAVMLRAFKAMKVAGAERMQFDDGCGLSRKNYVSPDFFVRFLMAMRSSAQSASFEKSIPQAGTGTLSTRLQRESEETRARVHMKSGSMNGVRCFSGYIMPRSGRPEDVIVFSFMTNNTIAASSRMNFIIDKIAGLLADEN